jgi:hypothetical protein
MDPELNGTPQQGDSSAEEIYAQLDAYFSGGRSGPDRRRVERSAWGTGLTVWFAYPWSPRPSIGAIEVETLNVSRGGLSFLADRFIAEGSPVRARFDSLPHRPTIAGIVRRCQYVGGSCHRVGVEFVAKGKPS